MRRNKFKKTKVDLVENLFILNADLFKALYKINKLIYNIENTSNFESMTDLTLDLHNFI
jgi:hypothetical protein